MGDEGFGLGLFVLEFAVGIDADEEAAVAEGAEVAAGRRAFEVGGDEIFGRGIGPIAIRGDPLVGDLGVRRVHLVVGVEVVEEDANFDVVFLGGGARGEADLGDDEGFAAGSPLLGFGDFGDGDGALEGRRRR